MILFCFPFLSLSPSLLAIHVIQTEDQEEEGRIPFRFQSHLRWRTREGVLQEQGDSAAHLSHHTHSLTRDYEVLACTIQSVSLF